MSDIDLNHEDEHSKNVLFTFVSDGDWLFSKGEHKKAIDSYMKILSIKPDDRSCYVGISKCHLQMGNLELALKEAENSLKGDKTYVKGLYQKAEALYYMGEFEFAKVCYHQGLRIRPELEKFRVGIQKAQEAIETAVGSPSTVKLENKGDLSFFLNDEEMRRKNPATAIQQKMMVEKKPQTTAKKTKNEKKDKQLLGEFYSDKKFLEDLLKDKDLKKVTTKKGETLQDVITGSLSYLETCGEFRKNVKPIAVKKPEKSRPRETRPKSSSERVLFFTKRMDEIESELMSGNAKSSLEKAEELLKTVQTWSPQDVQDKKEFLGMLHRCLGNAHLKLGDKDKTLDHYQKGLEIATQCKLHAERSRTLDNMSRVYDSLGQFDRAIDCQEKRIPFVGDAVEKTWMFHELGRWHLQLSRFEIARKYGLRSLAAAVATGDAQWQMNSNVLVAQSEMKLSNNESSVLHFEKALSHAKSLNDDPATNAIQEALDEVKRLTQNEDVPL